MKLSNSLTIRLNSRKAAALRLHGRLSTLLNSRPDWSPMECATYVLAAGLDAIKSHKTIPFPAPLENLRRQPALKGGRK